MSRRWRTSSPSNREDIAFAEGEVVYPGGQVECDARVNATDTEGGGSSVPQERQQTILLFVPDPIHSELGFGKKLDEILY
jgi:hypothetical protein